MLVKSTPTLKNFWTLHLTGVSLSCQQWVWSQQIKSEQFFGQQQNNLGKICPWNQMFYLFLSILMVFDVQSTLNYFDLIPVSEKNNWDFYALMIFHVTKPIVLFFLGQFLVSRGQFHQHVYEQLLLSTYQYIITSKIEFELKLKKMNFSLPIFNGIWQQS